MAPDLQAGRLAPLRRPCLGLGIAGPRHDLRRGAARGGRGGHHDLDLLVARKRGKTALCLGLGIGQRARLDGIGGLDHESDGPGIDMQGAHKIVGNQISAPRHRDLRKFLKHTFA